MIAFSTYAVHNARFFYAKNNPLWAKNPLSLGERPLPWPREIVGHAEFFHYPKGALGRSFGNSGIHYQKRKLKVAMFKMHFVKVQCCCSCSSIWHTCNSKQADWIRYYALLLWLNQKTVLILCQFCVSVEFLGEEIKLQAGWRTSFGMYQHSIFPSNQF